MHGVEPAAIQPQVADSVLSSIRNVVQTSPLGHAPPHVAAPGAKPPLSAQAVELEGRHVQVCGIEPYAQQLSPGGQVPPQPG